MSQTDRMDVLTGLLNLERYEVVEDGLRQADGSLVLTVVPDIEAAVCPHCGRLCEEVHQRRPRELIDLPMANRPVVLLAEVLQFSCPACRRAFTPPLPGVGEGTYATERFLQRAVELVRLGTVLGAAALLKVPEKTLERWYCDYVRRPPPRPPRPIRTIGIDELALKKNIGSSWP